MMNRRDFLLRSLGTSAGALIAPSLIWPFRKIFIPSALEPFWINAENLMIPGGGASELEMSLIPGLYRAYEEVLLASGQLRNDLAKRRKTFPLLLETPEEARIFDYPEQVKAIDPFTYQLLFKD
jgi:hypothetical protein